MKDLSKIFWISRYTFLEITRSKVLYAVLGLGFLIWIVSYVASEFSYGVPERVSLDFGLGLLSLSSLGISIFLGSTLILKEVENRTVYVVLTRPTSRPTFLVGKLIGLGVVIAVNTFILSLFTITSFLFQGGEWNGLILWAIIFTMLESFVTLVVVMLFSLLTNSILASLYGIGFVAVGHAIKDLASLQAVQNNPLLENFVGFIKFFIPDLSTMNLRTFILYDNLINLQHLLMAASSVLFYALAMIALSCLIFSRKQFE